MNKVIVDDSRSYELKEFMILWNQVTLETDVSSLNDKVRIREIAMVFLPKYVVEQGNTSCKDKKELWLGHLLNLYGASLISS